MTTQKDAAQYVAAMLMDMAIIAKRARLYALAMVIEMAALQAYEDAAR